MSSYLAAMQSTEPSTDPEPRVLSILGDDVDGILETLASDTRRAILEYVYEAPSTPVELATATGTSLQNVHYHLDTLEAVELIEPVGTRYSEKGREMSVFGPANDPLILVDTEETRTSVLESLDSIVGAVSVLVVTSALVQWITAGIRNATPRSGAGSAPGVSFAATSTEHAPALVEQLHTALLEPGALLFVGGIVAIAAFLAVRRLQR